MYAVVAKRLRLIRRQLGDADTGLVDDTSLQKLGERGALFRFIIAAGDEGEGKGEGE
ncbi:hypothetical protein D3C72_1401560 [compost metagenome]